MKTPKKSVVGQKLGGPQPPQPPPQELPPAVHSVCRNFAKGGGGELGVFKKEGAHLQAASGGALEYMCVCVYVCVKPKLERIRGNTICGYFDMNRKFNNQIFSHIFFSFDNIHNLLPFHAKK